MKLFVINLCCLLLTAACGTKKEQPAAVEDFEAEALLQGIWMDEETDMAYMRVQGDSLYYADAQTSPMAFKIVGDSIYIYGNTVTAYKIDRQLEYSFWFHSLLDEVVKLYKSEDPEDSLAFAGNRRVEPIQMVTEVVQKDSVVFYNGTRYRGYVYINPSQMKVFRTSYVGNGISVDHVYYDNVIHICVYEGKERLYSQDITKKMFADVFAPELLEQMVLADMNFTGVDSRGYHYQATLGIPESSVCNLVNLVAGFDSHLEILK
ncbi:MAG: DUF4738 domain-containing protein [Prevotellaceae bacterium]|nr:DUF4738 domain-containing protein [Prevotellaceae bacterium]